MELLVGCNLIFEGSVGAGKSTLCRSLEKYIKKKLGDDSCKFYPEFLNDKVLDLYLKDMKNNAYSYQIISIRERHRVLERSQNVPIGIIDRGVHGDLMFAYTQYINGFINDKQLEAYLELANFDFELKKANYLIYLEAEPEICYQRHLKRNRDIDKGYPPELFATWKKYYDMIIDYIDLNSIEKPIGISDKISTLLNNFPLFNVIRINYNPDINISSESDKIDDNNLEEILEKIYQGIRNTINYKY